MGINVLDVVSTPMVGCMGGSPHRGKGVASNRGGMLIIGLSCKSGQGAMLDRQCSSSG